MFIINYIHYNIGHSHGADTDVMRPSFRGKTHTNLDIACQQGHLNIVQHLIRHHTMPPDTLKPWHPRLLSSSNKVQLRQVARENLFDCQSFLTLATIIRYIIIEPYRQVFHERRERSSCCSKKQHLNISTSSCQTTFVVDDCRLHLWW